MIKQKPSETSTGMENKKEKPSETCLPPLDPPGPAEDGGILGAHAGVAEEPAGGTSPGAEVRSYMGVSENRGP